MQGLDPNQVVLEQRDQRRGKGREAILLAFPGPDGELLHRIVDMLDPQPDGFHDPQPAPVEELGHQLAGAVHQRQDGGDFLPGHHDGHVELFAGPNRVDPVRELLLEGTLIEEHQGIHRLVLGRSRDVALHRQVRQKRFDLGFGGKQFVPRAYCGSG